MFPVFCRNIKAKSLHNVAKRYLNVLGIESSCDDSSAAVVNDSGKILGEGHFSQSRFNLEIGGIIPIVACKIHEKFITSVVENAIKQSELNFKDLDAIAVTVKPGLILSLEVGLKHAKELCREHSKPLIPIHHMEAHALTVRLTEDVKFPFLTLLISGAHCILAIVESVDKFKKLGEALHNAPGHVLDRIARRAKLKNIKKFRGLVGGAAIEAAASEGDSSKFIFPKNILGIQSRNCDFSFCGFLTLAEKYLSAEEKKYNVEPDEVIPNVNDFCAGVLLALASHLCQRLEIAFHYIDMTELLKENEKCLVLSGGVACNIFLRKAVKKTCDHYGYRLVVPPAKFCCDNGAMVAWNGIERLRENLPVVQPDNLSSVKELSRCPLGEDISEDVQEKGRNMKFKYLKLKSYSEIAMLDLSSEEDSHKKTTAVV